jgi:hypothetical protein
VDLFKSIGDAVKSECGLAVLGMFVKVSLKQLFINPWLSRVVWPLDFRVSSRNVVIGG